MREQPIVTLRKRVREQPIVTLRKRGEGETEAFNIVCLSRFWASISVSLCLIPTMNDARGRFDGE